jgi:hypothetical protein
MTAITKRTIFQRGDDTVEFIYKPEIKRSGKVYRVIVNGLAVDWAYEEVQPVKTAKTAAFYFARHIDGTV